MNRRTLTIVLAAVAAVIGVAAIIFSSHDWIAHRAYVRAQGQLEARFNEAQQKKYATDLRYTLDKFWEFYGKGLISRNDLNDVMDRMHTLRAKKELADMDIFDFIGYVSRLYTEAMRKRQSEMFPE